jgi:hypothetical protein
MVAITESAWTLFASEKKIKTDIIVIIKDNKIPSYLVFINIYPYLDTYLVTINNLYS